MRQSVGAGVCGLGVVCSLAGTAAADDSKFGGQGQFAVSAERLFGVAWTTQSVDQNGGSATETSTGISLLAGGTSNPYSPPRVGFDYFVIDGLSLGGSIGYATISTHEKDSAAGVSTDADGPTLKGFIFAPRVGYAFMFNQNFGLWPRAGITYVHASEDEPSTTISLNGVNTTTSDSLSDHAIAISLEVPFVIAPIPHVAFTVAPTVDIGVSGSASVSSGGTSASVDTKPTSIGLQTGLLVWF